MQEQMYSQTQGVSTALIHSIVVLNISDQWTRERVQNDALKTVYGALLGKQVGRNIEIWNSFEISTSMVGGNGKDNQRLQINEEYFLQRSMLYKETFADLEFLGFYLTGDQEKTTNEDISVQRLALQHNESPFLLKFNTNAPVISDKLAIAVFDSSIDPADEQHLIFRSIPVKIVSELAEQIGLDHVARYSKSGCNYESTASKQMGAQFGAINTFLQGLAIAHDYVKAVQEGELEKDESILHEINKLCLKLAIHSTQPKKLSGQEKMQASDHKILVLLSAICSVQGAVFHLVEKVNVLARDHLHRERSSIIHHGFSMVPGSVRMMHPTGGGSRFFL